MSFRWKIEFCVELQEDADPASVEAWARFHLGETGALAGTNPLANVSLEADQFSVWATRQR